jgi:hypothetical protein
MNRLLYILFLFATLISCSKKDNPFGEPENEEKKESQIIDSSYVGYNMYFLENENLTGSDVTNADIDDLELQKPPFVAQENIQYYDTSSHVIYFFEPVELPEMGVHVLGKPFIVATDSFRHYVGVIWPMYSSSSYRGPVIDVMPRFYPKDIVKISMGRAHPQGTDFRLNDTITETLKNYDVFHAGISLAIDSVAILKNDSVNNDCTISYKIKIVNNDQDNLYVMDPLKMGNVFFWYNNSLYFAKDYTYYESRIGGTKPDEGVDKLSWFTKIESKDSVSWTLDRERYPYIPPGEYQCSFTYWGLNSSTKAFREQPDGRIWVGKITAECSIKVD